MERWQELLRRVEAEEPLAASAFVAGRLLAWSGDVIQLGYAPGSFELSRAQDAGKRRSFEEAARRLLGRALALRVREIGPDEAATPEAERMSAIEDRARKQDERAQLLREEARGHPLTRLLVQGFGANIESIIPEADEP
jgi:hypothetical protein